MANKGILQAQFKLKNSINLENGFIDNPLLKSVEGEINLEDENSFNGFASNSALEHLTTVKSSSQNATYLNNSLNNTNLKYIKLEGNFNSSSDSKFSGNTSLEKIDLSQNINIQANDFKDNEKLNSLPKIESTNSDLTDILTNDTNLLPTNIDLSNNNNVTKLGIHGDSTHQIDGLKGLIVSNEAPFDNATSPQLDVSYTGLNKAALVNLFNSMPYNVGYTKVGSPTITDGVASGFSASNYLTLPYLPSVSNLEMQISFKTPASFINNYETIFLLRNYFSLEEGLVPGGGVHALATYDWGINTYKAVIPSSAWSVNADYKVKVICTNGVFSFSYSKNGSDFTSTLTLDRSAGEQTHLISLGNAINNTSRPYNGSIDLNNTYIKVNGVPWFTGKAAMTKTCSVVGCTGTSSLTADDKAIMTNKGWSLTVE